MSFYSSLEDANEQNSEITDTNIIPTETKTYYIRVRDSANKLFCY